MMELPPTVCPSRVTRTKASNASAHLTNLAEARACRPFLFRMVTSALGLSSLDTLAPRRGAASRFARQNLARDADVLAPRLFGEIDRLGERLVFAGAGKPDQHRQIGSGDDLGTGVLHNRNRKVRRRAAEHIREHDHTRASVDPANRRNQLLAAQLHVILWSNGQSFHLALRTHYVLKRGAELCCEPGV